jgi:vacuolar-type H+-ATPase subunit E/Vma4
VSAERLRATLLAGAEAEAAALREEAERRAGDEVDRARDESARLQEAARSEGEAAGELETARELALARTEARRLVLEARQAVYLGFRDQALASALALRADRKAYTRLLDRLERAARDALGEGTAVERDPERVGGVRGRAGSRSVDLTLPVLVDDCIAALGVRAEALWR